MAQRLNKKLLLGLGSSLGFLGTGVVSGFGVNAIVNINRDNIKDQLALNTISEADFKSAPDYNVATREMFTDTTDLKRFHFGNTQIGQTVTANGWLGVFENSSNKANKIALTGWNGEIIWINDDYANETNPNAFNVYDMKYDYNTNLIFVLRTSDPRGISPNGSTPLTMDVLDARNGQRVDQIDSTVFQRIQREAYNSVTNVAYFRNTINDPVRSKKLFQLDIASKPGSSEVFVTWMPNYMQLINSKYGTWPTLMDFVFTFTNLMRPFKFSITKNNNGLNVNHKIFKFAGLNRFLTINTINWQSPLWNLDTYFQENFSLLTNPFFTLTNEPRLVLHLIVASNGKKRHKNTITGNYDAKDDSGQQVLHTTFAFNLNGNEDASNVDIQQIGGLENAFNTSNNEFKNWPFKINLSVNDWYQAINIKNTSFPSANLRINKNMFDGNSIVFAYPYASGSSFPIFNVMQLKLESNKGSKISYDFRSDNKKRSTNWRFGEDIVDYWKRNQSNYGTSANPTGDYNRIYPFPINNIDVNHNYNRLISVSPFDNTFIYGAKSSLKYSALQPDNNSNNNKYASFWIASDELRNNKPRIRPIVIANDSSIGSQTIDPYMTNVAALYTDGFTFDPRSLVDRSGIKSLNLYFNQNGTGKNDSYADNKMLSSKIGLFNDVLVRSSSGINQNTVVWVDNIATPYKKTEPDNTTFNLLTTGITKDSYSTLIHSRANLPKWYIHSWTNSNKPANMFSSNQRLNDPDTSADRAIAKSFGQPLNDPDVNSNKGVDLVSAWKDKNGNNKYVKNPPNYNRLAIKRPSIKVGLTSLGKNALSVSTIYELTPDAKNEVLKKPGWAPNANNTANLTLTNVETIENVSYQIVSSWQNAYKMQKIFNNTTSDFNANSVAWQEQSNPQWLDKFNQPNLAFGTGNNNVAKKGIQPLRLMLKLILPTGDLPEWFKSRFNANNDLFRKAYPIEPSYPGETTFREVVNEFANLKAEHINLSDNKNANAPVGLGNLKVEAYLELNPKFVNNQSNDKVYKLPDGKTKFLLDKTTNERIFYKDDFTQDRLIYDQSQINYDQFQKGAFGQPNTNLRSIIQRSWANGVLKNNFNIKVATNYDQLPNTLVRTAAGNNDPIFRFVYTENNTKIELTPIDPTWFKNRMENYNRLLNLFVQFEYQTASDNANTWNALGTFLTDSQIKAKMQNGKLILEARNNSNQLITNIKKIRFKLTTKGNSTNDPNISVWQENFQRDDVKYISAANPLAIENFVVQSSYISGTILTNANQSINSLTKNDIDNFIEQVKAKSSTTDADLRAKVSLTFDYNNKTNLNAQQLFDEIKAQRDGTEPFSLWNGTNGANRIRAKFVLLSTEGIQFVKPNGQTAADSDLGADVQANLKTEVDLTEYLNQLINGSLKLKNQPAVPGQMNGQDILFPANNAVSGYFATASFEEIKNKLESKLGVKVRFRAWNNQQDNWGSPTYNVNELKTYNVSRPEIGLSLEQQTNWNSKVIYNSTELGANNWFFLKLSLPKIIKNPNPNDTSQMIINFNKENIFSGNTWELNVGNNLAAGKSIVVDALIKASTTSPQDYNELKTNDALLILEFKLGNSVWMQADNLKAELAKQTTDQNDNSLKMRVRLSNEDNFLLATDLANQEFNLLPNDNSTIKKWIHGTAYEAALAANAITLKAGSNKNNLQYNYDNAIKPLFENQGRDGLIVQWRLNSQTSWTNLKGTTNPLPKSVGANESAIIVKVAKDPSSSIYLYGPESKNKQKEFRLDLSNIPIQIEIDNNWFNQEILTIDQGKFLQDITEQSFTNYENAFFNKSSSLTSANNATLRAKVKLEYQFNKTGDWMSGSQMVQSIRKKLNNFNSTDQGVWVLSHDGTTYRKPGFDKNIYVINAKVTTVKANDQTIEFINPGVPDRPISGDELAGNLRSNIQTKVNLSAWLNEILNAGITAVRGENPGQLDSATIQIPGKKAAAAGQPQVQFGGKDFSAIEQILNKVNVFVQYKKYDAAANDHWSGWLDNKTLVNAYDVKNPQIVLGFKKPHDAGTVNDRIPFNIKVFNNSDEFTNETAFIVKLNVPKLIKNPTNIPETIRKFNQQNPFGGNTLNLEINSNQLKIAQNQLINDIKAASQANSRFDNLETALVFKYKLGTTNWDTAEGLKTFLSQQNTDQTSNELKIKVELKSTSAGTAPEFELDPNGVWEYVLQNNNNTVIKKWLHGSAYETVLPTANAIVASGNKNALTYIFSKPLELFKNKNTFPDGLTLEYQLNGSGDWTKDVLPTTVDPSVNNIKVRIAKQDSQQIYLYGPEERKNQQQAVVDLTKIPVLVQIDKNWFSQIAITEQELQLENLTENVLSIWENKIWQKAGLETKPEIKSKLTIKYFFLDGSAGRTNLDKTNLKTNLLAEQSKYGDPVHHGIFKLNDPSAANNAQPNGIVIKATFAKADPQDATIQFVDTNGTNIDPNETDKTTGAVNTQKIQTTLNLSDYINYLKNTPTNVTTAGTAGTIAANGLVPPVLNGNVDKVLFATKSFKEIEQLLNAAGLELFWSINGKDSWKTTANTNQYNPQIGQLFLALKNNSTNFKVQLEQTTVVDPGQNSFKNPITINLNAPKVINVQPTDAQDLDVAFSGNTKYLVVDTTKITNKIQGLLAQQGNQFNNAPLTLLVKVGNEDFVDYQQLADTLKAKKTDVANGTVTVKFAIRDGQNNVQQWQIVSGGEKELPLITDQKIKIFINDQGIYDDLKNNTRLKGNDNTSFQFEWPNNWTVDPNGILNAGNKGKGLRLEFSFTDLPENQSSGTNIDNQWVETPPSSYALDKKQIYIRLQAQTNYVYEKIESNVSGTQVTPLKQSYKFALPLNLPLSIIVDQNWLNRRFTNSFIQLDSIQSTDFDFYENAVKQQIDYPQEIKDKIEIRYIFNGDKNNKLNRNQLIAKLNEYQKSNDDVNRNFGLLQLWNGTAGVQISTTFVKVNDNDPSYNLTWKNNQDSPVVINTEKIISTIDLINVVNWLENTKVSFNKGNAEDEIAPDSLVFDNVSAQGSPLNNKTWAQVETVLEALNIQVEYLPVFTNSPPDTDDRNWKPTIAAITKYDTRGQFKIRFRLEGNKGKNILVKIKNTENLVGTTTDVKSNPIAVNLKIVRKIIVRQEILNQFFIDKAGAINGNTKFLKINLDDEKILIDKIIADNNALFPNFQPPLFTSDVLKVRYALGSVTNQTTWKTAAALQQDLQNQQDDQISNLIKFKFIIETPAGQDVAYSVEETPYDFNSNDTQGQKIKFFVHTKQWETQANQLIVEGDKQALEWKFAEAFGPGQFVEKPLNSGRPQEKQQIYLKTTAGNLLQIHFSTNSALGYEETTVSDDLSDLAVKWVSIKPTQIGATDKLFIRIVPAHTGIVYEAAGDLTNNINKTAVVHEVQLQVSTTLKVNKNWFNEIPLSPNEIEIKQFNANVLNPWINQLKNKIKQENQLPDDSVANDLLNKINVQFSLDNQGTYNVNQVLQEINKRLNNFGATDFGIFHLWNPQLGKGLQIKATFVSTDNQLKLSEINGANLFDVLNTDKIYTLIDLSQYIKHLKTEKTSVTPKGTAGARPEEISAFNPPGMPGTIGDAFLSGRSYDEIATHLEKVGISIFFAQEPNATGGAWKPKNQINAYNPRRNKLYLSFTNTANNNIKLQIDNQTINAGANSQNIEIGLPLAVPRQINIDPKRDLQNFAQLINFGGNTKKITYNANEVVTIINRILSRNAIEAGNDQIYLSAPLRLKFRIGDTTEFKELANDELKKFLASYPNDLTSREIRWKFDLDDADRNDWIFDLETQNNLEGSLVPDDNNSPIKIYINDKEIFQDLKATKLSGSNTKLIWKWQNGLNVEAAEGILNANSLRGQGLRIEFTFNLALTGAATETTGTNNETDWVKVTPIQFKPQFNEIYLRIQLIDETKYTYEHLNEKITLDLSQIEKDLELETAWLNQLLIPANIANLKLEQLKKQHFIDYEKLVKTAAQQSGIDSRLIDKFDINYVFNGKSLTKEGLIGAIENFRTANADQVSLGILQLWNNAAGEKITAKFVDADASDQYIIKVDGQSVQNQPGQILETTKIQTEIDFSKVLNWLQTIKIQIKKGNQANSITEIIIPNVNSDPQDLYFNGKTWNQVQQALKEFGIIIQYRALKASNENQAEADWVENLQQINFYDPNYGKLQIRFKLDGIKSKNILFKLDINTTISGATDTKTEAFNLLLDVPLKLVIPQNLLKTFLAQKHISGNTKFLEINEEKEINFINEIIKFNKTNNSAFDEAADRLKIQYTLGNGQNNPQWFERSSFINDLQNKQNDLTSNQISLKFVIKNNDQDNTETKFDVEPTITEVVAHQIAKDAQVKIYAHEKGLEAAAEKIKITGTNNNFTYTYPDELRPNSNSDITGRVGLKLQYSTKLNIENAPYDSKTIDQDSAIGWTNVAPTTISAKDRYLVVQVVAIDGYVYGAEYAKTNPDKDLQTPAWKTHEVNVDGIKSQIKLNQSSLEQISFVSRLNSINVEEIKRLEELAKKTAQLEIPDLINKLKIEYQIQWTNKWTNNNWISIETLKTEVESYIKNYQNATLGLLKFNVNSTTGFATIKARFVSNDQQFVVLDKTINNPDQALQTAQQGRNANTDKFVSLIDLQEYVNSLKNNFIQLPTGATQNNISGFKPPMLAGQKGDKLFAGYEYDEIAAALLTIGIKIEFYAPTKGALPLTNDQWVDINQIQTLNANNDLFMRFRLDETKVNAAQLETWKNSFILSTNAAEDNWVVNADSAIATTPFKLKVDLPITLTTNKAELKVEFENEFKGNTFQINNDAKVKIKNKIDQLIKKTLNNNTTPGTNVTKAPLKIHFSLDGQVLKTEADGKKLIWFEFDDFVQALAANKTNWNTNQIQARWFIDPEQTVDGQKYLITDDAAIIVQAKNETRVAPLKMYIHKQNAYSVEETIKKALLVTGSTENYQIANLDDWIITTLPNGLQSQFSNKNPQSNPNDWISYQLGQANLPKPLNANKELWLRYEIKAGYEYQDALVDDVEHSQPIALDTSQLKTIIRLQKNWLKLIVMNGNTKIATFNEDQANVIISAAGVLPSGKNDLVQFQYAIDNNNWFNQADFINLLRTKDGAKDETNFILKRSEIQVRFNLNPIDNVDDAYQMQIDGDLIEADNRNQHNVQLINNQAKPPLNAGVRGYIEVSHLKDFVSANFAIEGSNTQPKLKIKQKTALETMMQNYATDKLFDILITGQQKNNGDWDFSNNISLLKAGNKFIDDTELIDRGFVIGANKKVALKFVALDGNYDVYFKGTQQAQGYLLDISKNVKVTFEIENPFVKQNKTLALWWTENQDKTRGKYFQGQGGFKIVNGLTNGQVDEADFQSALAWLQSGDSGLSNKEKEVLEFVYHIYDDKPTEAQIQEVGSHNSITNYDDTNTWKQLEPILDTINNNEHFTQSLGLKVGQYVSVALRVKKEYATGVDIYTLKDDEHSFMSPITTSSEPGRAHGYKVNTDAVNINQDQIILENMLSSDQPPLDGYTNIKRLNLNKDTDENYLGVNLRLELFRQFHQGKNNQQVIITPFDKIKLIKRQESNSSPLGNFKDANGDDFLDNQSKPIPILVDAEGKPTAPIMDTNPTLTKNFDNYKDGFFGLTIPNNNSSDYDKWGLFKNETIKIAFVANEGQGGQNDPDFILDKPKDVDLKDKISPQIKFPIFNQSNIKYDFNHDDFKKGVVEFVNATKPDQAATDGKSKVKTGIELIKKQNNQQPETIKGSDENDTVAKLNDELQKSFFGKLRFETIYEEVSGAKRVYDNLNVYKLTELKNGDRIKVNIVAADLDFIWAQPPKTLTIPVSGLTAKAPRKEQLRFLRVDQGGKIQGQGSFKVLVNDPEDPTSDAKDILQGWKFVLRVWDQDKKVKHDWTADQERISDLNNGDKVEWKLLDEFNNPVEDAYYNTVAGNHEQNSNTGETIFKFNQMQYLNGLPSGIVFQEGIGNYPIDSDKYPENSGFVISGLQDALEVFEISDSAFAKVMAQLEPHYVGLNGQGTINFKEDYLNKNYYVNANGELYEKPLNQPTLKQQVDDSVVEISLADFLANTTFYTSDPNLINYQNGFKFLGNDTNLNNHLSNGDQVWAQFDLRADNNEVNRGISTELNPVTGLKDVVTDPMTPLWYILMAIAGIVSLGGLSLLMIWAKRNRKFKK